MKMNVVLSFCLCLVSVVLAEEPATYERYNSSTPIPEIDPHKMGELTPMIVPQGGSDGGHMHTDDSMHSEPMEKEFGSSDPPLVAFNSSSLDSPSDFLSMSSAETGDANSTEPEGPTTKATHIMVIPRKNVTSMDMHNTTDSSMDKEASAATSEHGDHSKGAGSSASAVVVLTLFILSSRVLQSQ